MHLAICANDKTINVFEQVIAKRNNDEVFLKAAFEELIPALRDDLIRAKPKSWWQLWMKRNK